MRNILLVEPEYKNKYPPLGLMKISTYHKNKGDNVIFIKGMNKDILNRLWDRIYITTLFTFHFDLTVKTIRYYKRCVTNINNIYVGGILASLMYDKLRDATGINNIIQGQIDNSRKIGYKDNVCIDNLIPDYSILETIDYSYPAGDNYFSYTTRGCPNKCKFCAVPILEPKFKTTNNILKQIEAINSKYGMKRNLLLLDNNILYSNKLNKIINDIKKAGFIKKPNFIEPLYYEIIRSKILQKDYSKNEIDKLQIFFHEFKNRIKTDIELAEYEKLSKRIIKSINNKSILLKLDKKIVLIHNKYKNKVPKQRYVDFNQGLDASLLTEEKMKIITQIPINPLRIAFDSIKEKDKYTKAVRLAVKYQIKEVSNYILYNYQDKPEHLWERLKITADLREELGINIFSFPMKYIPISYTNRSFIGKYWNKKYLRAIQAILLVKKGIVSTNKSFFEKAFGKTLEEYFEILMMPEDFIIYRFYYEGKGLTEKWKGIYNSLNENEKYILLKLINNNNQIYLEDEINNYKIQKIL